MLAFPDELSKKSSGHSPRSQLPAYLEAQPEQVTGVLRVFGHAGGVPKSR